MAAGMQDKRTWVIGGAVAALAVAVAGWFFGVRPVIDDTSSVRDQTAAVQMQNVATQAKIAKLASTKSKLSSLQRVLAAALQALPTDNGLPTFTRQLAAEAGKLHLALTSVTVGAFSAANGATGAAGTPATSGTSGDAASGTTGSTGSTGTAATTTPAGGPIAIDVTVNSTGTAANQLAFLHVLRVVGPRAALVKQVSLIAATKVAGASTRYTMTTELTVFATPTSPAERAHLEQLLTQK